MSALRISKKAWMGLGLGLALGAGGCATNRAAEEINRSHDAARIAADAPLTVDQMMEPAFLKQFATERCGIERDLATAPLQAKAQCDDRLKQALFDQFSERYFAADRKAIEDRCRQEVLACKDPKILEMWIRASHNEGIESSRREKLARLAEGDQRQSDPSFHNRMRAR